MDKGREGHSPAKDKEAETSLISQADLLTLHPRELLQRMGASLCRYLAQGLGTK